MRCSHCGTPNPGVLHLFAGGPAPALRLVVTKNTACTTGWAEDFERSLFALAFNMASARAATGPTGVGDGTPATVGVPRPLA